MFSLSTLQMSKAPPVESSEQVADQAGPHECKENLLNIAGNSTNLHHLMLLLCSLFIFFKFTMLSTALCIKSCYFVWEQIPRHFSLVENKVTEGHS